MECGIYDILGSYYNIPDAIFSLLKGDYMALRRRVQGLGFIVG